MKFHQQVVDLATACLKDEAGLDSVEQVAELTASIESVINDYIGMLERRAWGSVND